jgi:hypothetical protein
MGINGGIVDDRLDTHLIAADCFSYFTVKIDGSHNLNLLVASGFGVGAASDSKYCQQRNAEGSQ